MAFRSQNRVVYSYMLLVYSLYKVNVCLLVDIRGGSDHLISCNSFRVPKLNSISIPYYGVKLRVVYLVFFCAG
jgi:hypothetical protein